MYLCVLTGLSAHSSPLRQRQRDGDREKQMDVSWISADASVCSHWAVSPQLTAQTETERRRQREIAERFLDISCCICVFSLGSQPTAHRSDRDRETEIERNS